VDFWNPYACMAARAMKKPLMTVIQADMHPHSRGFIWWKEPPEDIPTPVPVVNKVLAAYHLHPVNKMGELFLGDVTLVMGTPETDPLPEENNLTYIGPMIWQKPEAERPDWMFGLHSDKPVVWVYPGNPSYGSAGSWADSAVVLHACISALADEDVQVVLTTGHHALPKGMKTLPANFIHKPYVPALLMAGRSDLLIHHGGYASCQTGLFTGTPAVIVPTMAERESNARRVAGAGAGDFVLPTAEGSGKKHVNVEELREKVRKVLAEHSYTVSAKHISEKMQAYGGAPEAARIVEGFINVSGGGTGSSVSLDP